MLLTMTASRSSDHEHPATDLGYVLHKHPDNVRERSTTAGTAYVFWPSASEDSATVALLVDVDPVGLVRRGPASRPLAPYVNDRSYVASSFLSVAIGRLFRSALNGSCPTRPDLVDVEWSLTVELPAVPVGGDPQLVGQLFEPLGYDVEVDATPLDPTLPSLGPAPVASIQLSVTATVKDVLGHLYVLLPVLDDDKHYWVDDGEVDKLLRHGEGWLADHPQRRLIARRYLRHLGPLSDQAMEALGAERPTVDRDGAEPEGDQLLIDRPVTLHGQRIDAVVAEVIGSGGSSVIDIGCGEGNLAERLAGQRTLDRLLVVDVAPSALARTARRLRLEDRPERQRPIVDVRQSSLTYRDQALEGYDVACLVEVIEHIDPERLGSVEQVLFGHYRPTTVIVTTPNRDHNAAFNLREGALRHRDHRFEWTQAEFAAWCERICGDHGYRATITPIGPVDPELGPPTQMAVLTRTDRRPGPDPDPGPGPARAAADG